VLDVFVDMTYTVKPSLAPNPSRFSGVAERLAKVLYSHTATNLVSAAIDYS
jgi:hypothetical protein